MIKGILGLILLLGALQATAQDYPALFPDTTVLNKEPAAMDSSHKAISSGWAMRNLIWNGTTPQNAHYSITNTNFNSPGGDILGVSAENFAWNSVVSPSEGALYAAKFNYVDHGFNYAGNQEISDNATLATQFNRLTLTAQASSSIEMDGNGNIPRAISASETQVYLPAIASGLADTVSDVASVTIQSAYQDGGTTNSVAVTNYYQLLIEPSTNNLSKATALTNTYAIFQTGKADTNVLRGPLAYANKYSMSATPGISGGSGAGSAPSVNISGTTDGGVVTITTGSGTSAGAVIATVSLNGFSFPTGCSVILYPASASAAALTGSQAVYTLGSASGWTLTAGGAALSSSTTYVWNYQVSGY